MRENAILVVSDLTAAPCDLMIIKSPKFEVPHDVD